MYKINKVCAKENEIELKNKKITEELKKKVKLKR